MSNPSPIRQLGVSALEAVTGLFLASLTRPLNTDFVQFELDVTSGQLVIAARSESDGGVAGTYRGSYRWDYRKANLNLVIPHPLAVEVQYPLTFRQLRTQVMSRYGIYLEEKEFSLTDGGPGLEDDDILNTPLLNEYGQFRLYATDQSGRFVAGSSFALIFLQPHTRVPLRGLFDVNNPNPLGVLAAG